MQRIGVRRAPQADVIVTNPEHLAIAIQYDQAAHERAPTGDRQGRRPPGPAHPPDCHASMRIPIVERKPLARALYRQVGVGQEVPPEFYQAVAEVLAYVYRLSGAGAVAG